MAAHAKLDAQPVGAGRKNDRGVSGTVLAQGFAVLAKEHFQPLDGRYTRPLSLAGDEPAMRGFSPRFSS